ncbi:MAG: glycerophosphodiester phosphodiesterase family protein [Siphonobacter aquaeclarae]|jgi:glycerophosphoryl diester phosphodiesterase|nr:glycerophosphodiester phosphodiesterase family protein [Siphonobacter aquaeclarae]
MKFFAAMLLVAGLFSSTVSSRLIVIAHRGDHTAAPEGTLKAFRNAISLGVDYVEVDVRTSRDGALVVMHDGSVSRTTNGSGNVRDLTLSELRSLKVINKYHPEYGEEQIPLLEEVLQVCKGKINIYLDFKEADAARVWEAFRKAGMEKSLAVYINNDHSFREWRKVAPEVPLIVSLPKQVFNGATLRSFLDSCDAEILDGPYTVYTEEMVRVAAERKRRIWADIQHPLEGPVSWQKAVDLGLHGLQTDKPAGLIGFLREQGKR